jgi:hypothetical protein
MSDGLSYTKDEGGRWTTLPLWTKYETPLGELREGNTRK